MQKVVPLESNKFYHIYNRGNNSENIFKEYRNYAYFLMLWEKHIHPIAETYAYCLLKNHFHFLIRIRGIEELKEFGKLISSEDEIPKVASKAFSNFYNAYSKSINKAYNRTGSLFEERFERIWVYDENYFSNLVNYIHQNPQKHGFIDNFIEYPHSSYMSFLSERKTKLMREEVINWFGDKEKYQKIHQEKIGLDELMVSFIGEDY